MKMIRAALAATAIVVANGMALPVSANPFEHRHHGFLMCCVGEDFDLLPEEYKERLQRRIESENLTRSLTLLPVDIDPLGADPDTPWTVFANSLNVRSEPQAVSGNVIGSLASGIQVTGVYNIVQESDEEWLSFDFNETTGYSHRIGLTRPHPANVDLINQFGDLPIGDEIVNRWWGIPISYEASDLAIIPEDYTNRVVGRVYQLRQDALDSLIDMIDEARDDGVNMWVLSPYRSGAQQVTIYTNNTNNNLAQRSSAPPGHSEHQLGTTVDFSNASPGGSFINNTSPQWIWLSANAHRFGWVQTYTADNIDETGYIEEPWHWRFFGLPDEPTRVEPWMMY